MATFSVASSSNLAGVHPVLVAVCQAALQVIDFKVMDGVRTIAESQANQISGVSRLKDPTKSKHLPQADGYGHAVDLAPWPVNWQDIEMFCVLAGVMFAEAKRLGVRLRWGGDWNSDRSTLDERFRDYGHFELVG